MLAAKTALSKGYGGYDVCITNITKIIREAESAAAVKANAESDRMWCRDLGIEGEPIDSEAGSVLIDERRSAAYKRGRREAGHGLQFKGGRAFFGGREVCIDCASALRGCCGAQDTEGEDCTKLGRKHRRLASSPICADCGMGC